MTITRYKIMAGILGVSLGGLAVAGQCSRTNPQRAGGDMPPADAKAPNAGSKPAATLPPVPPPPAELPPLSPTSPVGVDLPGLPVPTLPAPPATGPSKLPELPPITPVKAELPKPAAVPTPVVLPASGTSLPDVPPALPAIPEKAAKVEAPAAPTKAPAPVTPPPAPPKAEIPAAVEPLVPPPPAAAVPTPPATATPSVPPPVLTPTPAVEPAPSRPAAAPVAMQQAGAATRFRILLRVGEGEPMFEVKSGDDLVLRVVCEKVDVKSPEKGQGPSSVVATGKVRFVGFGAEGTCDSLSFLAGTGEVAMTGAVRVQVKDKIGRVESELTSDRLQYRLDAASLPGTLRP